MSKVFIGALLGLMLELHHVACYTHLSGWRKHTNNDGVVPTSGGYQPDVTSSTILQCSRLCKDANDQECIGFVYISDTSTCQLHNTTWNVNSHLVINSASAAFYTQLWSYTCDTNWTRIGNSCYILSPTKLIFDDANTYCGSQGSHLVHIENEAENSIITDLCKAKRTGPADEGVCWLGMTHAITNSTWYYTDTGLNVGYMSWGPGEPNGSLSPVYCATINGYYSYRWTDDTCTWVAYAVCETSALTA